MSASAPAPAGATIAWPDALAAACRIPRPRWLAPLRPAAFACLLVCLTGCTGWREYLANGFKVGPNYGRPAAPVADDWIDSDDPSVSSEPPDDAAWWQTFDDPVLDSLVQAAYRQNLTLRAAGMRILQARAQRAIAAGQLFPQQQQLSGGYTRTGNSRNTANVSPNRFFDEWALGIGAFPSNVFFWELDFWGRFRRGIEAADADLDASVEDYDDVLVLLVADVARSYLDVRTAEQRLKCAENNVKIQQNSLNLADVKYREGATTRLDVTQGQSNLSQTQSLIPPLEASRRQAANQLCILLGMPPKDLEEELQGRKPIPSVPAQAAVGIPADLLRRRPDVRRAEREVAAQSARIGIATSDLYPHISLSGSIFFEAANFKDLFDSGSLAGNVGPSFRWDILNYGRLVNNIRFQEARFQELATIYQNTVLQANTEAENALVAFLKSQQQVKFLAESTEASRQSVELVQTQYNAGQTDFNRVLIVEQTLTQQEDQLAVAQGVAAASLVDIYKALGGGWQIRLAADQAAPVDEAETDEAESAEPAPAPAPKQPATPAKEKEAATQPAPEEPEAPAPLPEPEPQAP